jgi:hypothetical protein
LFTNDSELIDQVTYPSSSIENLTYGRLPDGSDNWEKFLPPTPLQPNFASN